MFSPEHRTMKTEVDENFVQIKRVYSSLRYFASILQYELLRIAYIKWSVSFYGFFP